MFSSWFLCVYAIALNNILQKMVSVKIFSQIWQLKAKFLFWNKNKTFEQNKLKRKSVIHLETKYQRENNSVIQVSVCVTQQ